MRTLVLGVTLATISSLLTAQQPFPVDDAHCIVKGRVRLDRALPRYCLSLPAEAAKKLGEKLPHPRYEYDELSLGLPNVVVSISGAARRWRFATKPRSAKIRAAKQRFVPHTLALQRGAKLEVTNELGETLGLLWELGKKEVGWNKLENGRELELVFEGGIEKPQLMSSTQYWMRAQVVEVEHPLFAVTDDIGRFELPPLPAGDYELVVQHGLLGRHEHEFDIAEGQTRKNLRLTLPVPEKEFEKQDVRRTPQAGFVREKVLAQLLLFDKLLETAAKRPAATRVKVAQKVIRMIDAVHGELVPSYEDRAKPDK